mgnify:CR=1 FL=1
MMGIFTVIIMKNIIMIMGVPGMDTIITSIVALTRSWRLSTDMTDRAKSYGKRIFKILAEAEAKAHNVPVNQIHFHEVGAVDSIVDILSVAICMDDLDVEEVIVPLGQHIGKPATPVVKVGDMVHAGDLIAEAAEGLSANLHTGFAGIL